MKCKYCEINDAVKYSKYSSGKFCSKLCSRAYSTKEKRSEINKKISAYQKQNHTGGKPFNKGFDRRRGKFSDEHRRKATIARKLSFEKYVKESNFECLSKNVRRKILTDECNGKCQQCGISTWQENKLVLELHHINGNSTDHRRENSKMLCPNCHSITPNFRNKKRN